MNISTDLSVYSPVTSTSPIGHTRQIIALGISVKNDLPNWFSRIKKNPYYTSNSDIAKGQLCFLRKKEDIDEAQKSLILK
jgi:hypothetical protein